MIIFISITLASILIGCESIDGSIYSTNHPVVTIDRSQANSLNCVYLYNTEKKESGWNNSSATANALRVLKDQAQVAGGNAVIIRDIYSSEEYREGYQLDAAGIYVDVYKCPFNENKEKID
ncbi:MAG: hypothetical protein DBW94_02050 [Gammaproteobacteria bacterium]|nr:MAG: hypothetical protein DBW94_02050 [Gammaproteobacteria bacterium]